VVGVSSLPPQAASDIDKKTASGNAAEHNGRTRMNFSLKSIFGMRTTDCGMRLLLKRMTSRRARKTGGTVCATREDNRLDRGAQKRRSIESAHDDAVTVG